MSKQQIQTDQAPAAIGPYSQAIRAGGFIFTSGQIAIDPATNEMVEGGVEDEARQVMCNLQAVLEAAGAGFEHVVRTTIFLADMADFACVNEVYASFLKEPYPARATVAVRTLPKSVRVEIDMVAFVG